MTVDHLVIGPKTCRNLGRPAGDWGRPDHTRGVIATPGRGIGRGEQRKAGAEGQTFGARRAKLAQSADYIVSSPAKLRQDSCIFIKII